MDTSSAFANPTLGTKRDDPKARYTLIAQAVEEFKSKSALRGRQ
jgi:polyribonucleotide 5'-hydroxyl-kinase